MNYKKFFIIFILTFFLGFGFIILNKEININKNIEKNKKEEYINFKIKFNVELLNNNLLPNKILKTSNNKINSVNDFLSFNNLEKINFYFDVYENKKFYDIGEIVIFPKNDSLTKKYNRYNIDNDFFIKYGLDRKLSKSLKEIFIREDSTIEECIKIINEKYKSVKELLEFINVATYFILF
ncbi:hypothetical protein SLITO_v1c04680 [Spiroplasma litorale]|uniref:Uncharacterized protein n=1 Tax=Spiroplasma litorale TaxID=216942 RepID=A0A0K1W1Q9_9MOLU|nr:hypothetical protein [Spiroplasma litorale]AKX34121.1 hypothetical protein SLITO_v1c04680 [Spiroplasma litorale]